MTSVSVANNKNSMRNFLILSLLSYSLLSGKLLANDPDARTLREKTFVRDNTFCHLGEKKVEIEIRGFDQYTDPQDARYGDKVFSVRDKVYRLLPLAKDNIGRYRLLLGEDPHCSKSLSLKRNAQELTVFFLKDNRPFPDLLTLLHYDFSGSARTEETAYPMKEALVEGGKLFFSSVSGKSVPDLKKVRLKGQEYTVTFQELPVWYVYDGKNFRVDQMKTYHRFDQLHFFPTREDFEAFFQWDADAGKYRLHGHVAAVNAALREKCLARTITDKDWRCRKKSN